MYLSEDGEWVDVLSKPPLFPTLLDLYPMIDDFTRGKILELDKLQEDISLIFRYRSNWTYGVGYSKSTSGTPMTLSEFYVEVSRIITTTNWFYRIWEM
jgi:hypothetical protein